MLAARDFASKRQLDENTAALRKAEAYLSELQAAHSESPADPTDEERAIANAKGRRMPRRLWRISKPNESESVPGSPIEGISKAA